MTSRIITCRELDGFLADYLAGALSRVARGQFEVHLSVCPACVRYVQNYRRTVQLGKQAFADLDRPPDEDEVPRELIDAILEARRHSTR